MKTIYDYSVKDRKGKIDSLREYAGEVLLIVNTATRCGFTPQYTELEQLYEKYHAQGFEVLDSLATNLVSKLLALQRKSENSVS